MTIDEAKEAVEKAEEVYNQEWQAAMDAPNVAAYMAACERAGEKFRKVSWEYDKIREPVLVPLGGPGLHMPMEDFKECVESGGFIDYDGSGNYATATHESDISIIPSDIEGDRVREDFTHVVWYNR